MKALLSTREYLKIKDWYWICSFKKGEKCSSRELVFSKTKPPPVPNPNMDWFTPTFEELCIYNKNWSVIHDGNKN